MKIVFVIDESGSMESIKNDMIGSINSFIDQQEKIQDDSTFTIIKFATKSNIVCNNVPLSKVKRITSNDYNPSGGTALNDALGMAIEMFKDEPRVMMIIVTDGQENSSKIYTSESEIKSSIQKHMDHGWKFIYLCTDISIQEQGSSRGISVADTRYKTTGCNNVAVDSRFLSNVILDSASSCTSAYRTNGAMPRINAKGKIV